MLSDESRPEPSYPAGQLLKTSTATKINAGVSASDAENISAHLDQPLDHTDLRHLTQRTGFGTSAHQFDALIGLTRQTAIDAIVEGLATTPQTPMPAWTSKPAPRFWSLNDYESDELQRFHEQRDLELGELRQWWLAEMLQSSSPQTERLVLFWHDHFATSYHDINRQSIAMARQNATFRKLGSGSYRTLLKAMIRDPALLNYLDNTSNKAEAPNENFGRELLELFTLGEGNFTELDVKNAARALTGYHVAAPYNLQFRKALWNHDSGEKSLFNRTGPFDGDDLIDLILQQPAAAQHLAKKFWHTFVSDAPPDQQVINAWAAAFIKSDYNLTTLYRTVLESDAFWSANHRASIIKSPVQLLVGTARSLEFPKVHWQSLSAASAKLGMELFAPPNVAGWSAGPAFVTSGHLLSRYQILGNLLNPTAQPTADGGMMMNADNTAMATTDNAAQPMQGDTNKDAWLTVTAAAESYRGDVDYRVDLENDTGVLWSSGVLTFTQGYNTELFGQVQYRTELPWRVLRFTPPASLKSQVNRARIYFLNDAASDAGDRNLYISGIEHDGRWVDSATAEQDSGCPPNNSKDNGNLYCEGFITLALPENSALASTSDTASSDTASSDTASDYTAESAHIWWANHQGDGFQNTLSVTLQGMQGPSSLHQTLGFTLRRDIDGSIALRMQRYSCWPECVDPWPACSWRNAVTPPTLTVSFPFSRQHSNDDIDCHYTSLSLADQQRVDVLWNNIDIIIDALKQTRRAAEFSTALADWSRWLRKLRVDYPNSRYAASDMTLSINKKQTTAAPLVRTDIQPPVVSRDIIERLGGIMDQHNMTLADWLLAGLDLSQFTDFASLTDLPLDQQIQQLITHPVLQVQ